MRAHPERTVVSVAVGVAGERRSPDDRGAGGAQRGALMAAVGNALGLGEGMPLVGAVEGQELGREVVGGVVDGE